MDERELVKKATQIYNTMLPQINAMARKRLGFNSVCELADYQQEAWVAIRDAVLHYSTVRITEDLSSLADTEIPVDELPADEIAKLNETVMKPETFAHWYISKAMDSRADTKEIEFRVFDQNGEYIETLSNTEYRKRKRQIQAAGYTVDSTKKTISFSEYDSRRADSRDRYEPADPDSFDLMAG